MTTTLAPTRRSLRAAATAPADRRGRGAARVLRGVRRVLLDVAAAIGALSILVTLACLLLGVRPAVVVSGSMAPGIPVGALTVARTVPATEVAVGDVVTVPRATGSGLVTHRVIETTPAADGTSTVLRLQGDANTEPDALPYTVTQVGRVLGSVPYVGFAVLWLQQHLLLAAGVLLTLTALVTLPLGRSRG